MTDKVITNADGKGRDVIVSDMEGVWQHPCGSQLFWLNEDGTVNCGLCKEPLHGFRWTRERVQ